MEKLSHTNGNEKKARAVLIADKIDFKVKNCNRQLIALKCNQLQLQLMKGSIREEYKYIYTQHRSNQIYSQILTDIKQEIDSNPRENAFCKELKM